MQYIVSDNGLEQYYNSRNTAICHSWQCDEFENVDFVHLSDLICKISANNTYALCVSLEVKNVVERHLNFEQLLIRKFQVECGALTVWMDKYVDNVTRVGILEIDYQHLPAMLTILHIIPRQSFGLAAKDKDRINKFLTSYQQLNCTALYTDIAQILSIAQTEHLSLLHTMCGNDGCSVNYICPFS